MHHIERHSVPAIGSTRQANMRLLHSYGAMACGCCPWCLLSSITMCDLVVGLSLVCTSLNSLGDGWSHGLCCGLVGTRLFSFKRMNRTLFSFWCCAVRSRPSRSMHWCEWPRCLRFECVHPVRSRWNRIGIVGQVLCRIRDF